MDPPPVAQPPVEIRTTGNQIKVAAGEGIDPGRRELGWTRNRPYGPSSSGRGHSAVREPSAKSSRDIKRHKAPSVPRYIIPQSLYGLRSVGNSFLFTLGGYTFRA